MTTHFASDETEMVAWVSRELTGGHSFKPESEPSYYILHMNVRPIYMFIPCGTPHLK
jgi:hypothetical protein